MHQVTCPDCDVVIELPSEPEVDQIIICMECGAEIRITAVKPTLTYEVIEEEK